MGVKSTLTCTSALGSDGPEQGGGLMWMSGRLTTASWPRERGCSGSEMVDIKSMKRQLRDPYRVW